MNEIAILLGYSIMLAGGLLAAALMLGLAAYLFNRGVHRLLDAYGGWKVFLEYRKWYHNHRAAKIDTT